ncbi:hypothetical protein Taro_030519 [Colocasia esculenta]|uniref:PUM-HD domain-containing protein n=2 Tax=Magnoliopsida TaxID=3398 RepID=A0A843VU89_COLES|nr:hypothetical protein [Colocasia esculenta]
MVTESLRMLSDMGMRAMIGSGGGGGEGFSGEDAGKELGMLLREQRRQEASDRERELNLYRSGSAPPTVEGSITAVGRLFGAEGGPGFAEFARNGNGFLSEEELRSDPAYLSYYYSHVNLNPRLPPPVLSKEDWRFTQRLQAGSSVVGGIGDQRKVGRADEGGSRSLFSMQPGFNPQKEEREADSRKMAASGEWLDKGSDGLIGLSGLALGGRQKSIADIFQDDLGCSASVSRHPSRPASRNAFDDSVESLGSIEAQVANLHNELASVDNLRASGTLQVTGGQPVGSSISHSFASVVGSSLSRSNTPDPQLVARAPSPCLPPVGVRIGATDKKTDNGSNSFNAVSSGISEPVDIVTALSGMNLSRVGVLDNNKHAQAQTKLQKEVEDHQNFLFDFQGRQSNIKQHPYLKKSASGHMNISSAPQSIKSHNNDLGRNTGDIGDLGNTVLMPEVIGDVHKSSGSAASSFLKPPSFSSPGGSPVHYQNTDTANEVFTSYGLSGYSLNPTLSSMVANQLGAGNLLHLFQNSASASAIGSLCMDSRLVGAGFSAGPNLAGVDHLPNLNRIGNYADAAAALQMPLMDPTYLQYLRTAEYAAQVANNFTDPSIDRSYMGNSYLDVVGLQNIQKAYLNSLLSSQKQYGMPFSGKVGGLNHGYYGNSAFGLGMSYTGSPLASPILPGSPVGPGSPLRHGDRNVRFPTGMRNLGGGVLGSWRSDGGGSFDDGFASSLLEEFKSNKAKCFELSEISGHVVEFSADQYGSRFIQQKLETATTEEKNMVFEEIMPQALSLMTDVFGNYVIQKFFEHGTAAQRRELADQLTGHVLTLSLQMYGCRVIQKAIEVVDLDQQTKMVAELEGHVMRCVRDQNGNHVIQKCIECIPQDAIQFIVSSFYDQVVTLSTHPYGCRVIQRVLEYCDDPKTQRIMMDEILQSVCMLAQDQYGNYVVQFLLLFHLFCSLILSQHVLEHGKPHERSSIIKKLSGQIVQMSQQKFASNVVEKCLTFGSPAERQILVNEMLGTTDENEPLQAMMKDQFGNYVVQKVLETSDDQQRELILSRIKAHLTALKKYTYGKHIVARVEKLVTAGGLKV